MTRPKSGAGSSESAGNKHDDRRSRIVRRSYFNDAKSAGCPPALFARRTLPALAYALESQDFRVAFSSMSCPLRCTEIVTWSPTLLLSM